MAQGLRPSPLLGTQGHPQSLATPPNSPLLTSLAPSSPEAGCDLPSAVQIGALSHLKTFALNVCFAWIAFLPLYAWQTLHYSVSSVLGRTRILTHWFRTSLFQIVKFYSQMQTFIPKYNVYYSQRCNLRCFPLFPFHLFSMERKPYKQTSFMIFCPTFQID